MEHKKQKSSHKMRDLANIENFLDNLKEKSLPLSMFTFIFNMVDIPILVLNKERSIIYTNEAYQKDFLLADEKIIGSKIGETFFCNNSTMTSDGCGSYSDCKGCEMINAFKKSQKSKTPVVFDFEMINTRKDILSYKVSLLQLEGLKENYILCILFDTGAILRAKVMENTFLHDLKNRVSIIQSASEHLYESLSTEPLEELESLGTIIKNASNKAYGEIVSYENIISSNEKYGIKKEKIDIKKLISNLTKEAHHLNKKKNITFFKTIENDAQNFVSDKILLSRAILNGIKNAIEASSPNENINICVKLQDKNLIIDIKNKGTIPPEIQEKLFNDIISTKGQGRGLGCLSMKLIIETFLKGSVTYISDGSNETLFTFKIPQI